MRTLSWLQSLMVRFRPEPEDTGAAGERMAAAWLKREKGFRVLARNWRAKSDRRLELDIVARDGDSLVFVEVKSRPDTALVSGYYAAVQRKKKRAVLRACRAYIRALSRKPRTVRYDVVEVVHSKDGKGETEVRHFENVPLFSKEYLRGR